MKKAICIIANIMCVMVFGFSEPRRDPTAEQVEAYISERLSALAFTDPKESDFTPKTSGQVFYDSSSDILGPQIRNNIGNILYVAQDGKFQIEPLLNGQYWKDEPINEEDSEILTWFSETSSGVVLNLLAQLNISHDRNTAAKMAYKRVSQYVIKPEYDYSLQAALLAIRNEICKNLPGYVSMNTTNRWIITGVIVNKLSAEEFIKWDFKGNVSVDLVGVGGSLYYKNSHIGKVTEWRSYYTVTSLEAAIRSGYSAAFQDTSIERLLASISRNTTRDNQNLLTFINKVQPEETGLFLTRLDKDSTFLTKIKATDWSKMPGDYNVSIALQYIPSEKLADPRYTAVPADSAMRAIEQTPVFIQEEPWMNEAYAEDIRNSIQQME